MTQALDIPTTQTNANDQLVQATATITAAMIQANPANSENVADLIHSVHHILSSLGGAANTQAQGTSTPRPSAVSVEDSIQADYLVCLEDGKKLKMLKRYLKTNYNMTPEEYRQRWNLPATYPMVAPEYANRRSKLAKQFGLGKPTAAVSRSRNSSKRREHASA